MYSVYVKGDRDLRDADLVKLTLIIYRSGYNRVPKQLLIAGRYSEWNKKTRAFETCSADNIAKNKLIQQERIKYLKLAERWEYSGKEWTPIDLARYYDVGAGSTNRDLTVSRIFDLLIDEYASRRRIRNNKVFAGQRTATSIKTVKRSLERFTLAKHRKNFSLYHFKDIDRRFILDYLYYESERGSSQGNRGNIDGKLRRLKQTFVRAKELGIYSVNLAVFDIVSEYLKPPRTFSKAVSHETIMRIEQMDRSGFLKREKLYIDLFLFSYHAGGMTGIDICHLEHSWIVGNTIEFERIKYPNRARVILTDKALALIEKYRDQSYMDYVFPIFKRQKSPSSMMRRVSWINLSVNKILEKVCEKLEIPRKITWGAARSSFISRMLDEGYTPTQVAEQTGNSPATIYKHYYAITNTEEVRAKMNKIF